MNKLSALSKLANAYWYLAGEQDYEIYKTNKNAAEILEDRFGYIRRSLTLRDLAPQPKQPTEGINPPGPKFF